MLRPLLSSLLKRLTDAGVPNAKQEAGWLACHALGLSSAELMARPDMELTSEQAERLDALFQCRAEGEPLQYIIGDAPFFGRDFNVGAGVLIPRHDTETLISAVKSVLPKEAAFGFMDWGTGSGCIAITLLLEFPKSTAIMAEKSQSAIEYARLNLERYGLENRAVLMNTKTPDDIRLTARLEIVISNPPYIPTDEIPTLMREVRDYEPHEALDGGADGLDCYRALFRRSPYWLKPGGLLFLENGSAAQSEAMRSQVFKRRFNRKGLTFIREFSDDAGVPRCSLWKNGK